MLSKGFHIIPYLCTMQTLRVTHIPYSVFEIYHAKYTDLVESNTWQHFRFIVLLNLLFTMLITQISYKYHIYAQCRL